MEQNVKGWALKGLGKSRVQSSSNDNFGSLMSSIILLQNPFLLFLIFSKLVEVCMNKGTSESIFLFDIIRKKYIIEQKRTIIHGTFG